MTEGWSLLCVALGVACFAAAGVVIPLTRRLGRSTVAEPWRVTLIALGLALVWLPHAWDRYSAWQAS